MGVSASPVAPLPHLGFQAFVEQFSEWSQEFFVIVLV